MADITPEQRERARARMIAHYKSSLSALWSGLEPEWDSTYAVNVPGQRGEKWSAVSDLWSSRYGSMGEAEGLSDDGTLALDAAQPPLEQTHSTSAQRSGYAVRLTNDGINAMEQMTDAEFDEWAFDADGNWRGNLPASTNSTFGSRAVFEKLKAHLIDTRGHTGEDRVADTLEADDDHNMLTGDLLDRSNDADSAAAKPPASPDTTKATLSRAGIAYDTVEYREQCFLLSQLFKIVEHKTDIIEEEEYKPLAYVDEGVTIGEGETAQALTPTNACLMVDALSPYAFMNKLTQYPDQQTFLDLDNRDLSQLQPQIRLFRVSEKPNESFGDMVETSTEMVFNTSTTRQDLEEFMKPTGKRGFGAGIKSFNVAYEASNPFALKKSISAELTIFANTFDELVKDRGGYSYIDLALKTGGYSTLEKYIQEHGEEMSADEQSRLYNLSKLNFRLKAVVGWMKPPGVQGLSHSSIAEMLNTSFVTINLTPTIHTFDFDEMGRVIFKIQYLAYIDDFFDEPSYSIFSDSVLIEKHKEREATYRQFQQNCDSEGMAAYKEKMGLEVGKDLAQQRASMWRELKNSSKLRFINLKYSTLRKFQEKGPYFDLLKAEAEALDINNLRDATQGQRAGLAASLEEYTKNPTAKGHGHKDKKNANSTQQVALVYFYVSDLLDIILDGIEKDLAAEVSYYRGQGAILEGASNRPMAPTATEAHAHDNGFGIFQNEKPPLGFFAQMFVDAMGAAYSAPVPDPQLEKQKVANQLDLRRAIRMHENFKRYRVVLGPIEIINPANPSSSRTVNLGDLPVSFKYFMEWLTGRTLAKDRPYYSISAFMNDFMNGLINGFINDGHCFPRGRGQTKQKTYLSQAAITAYNRTPDSTDVISKSLLEWRTTMRERVGYDFSRLHLHYHDGVTGLTDTERASAVHLPIRSWPLFEMSGPPGSPVSSRNLEYEMNYVCYYAGRQSPQDKMNGDLQEDLGQGIMHYTAGKDTGIVKNIKFQKTETPGLKEVRFEQEGYDGLKQLREVYNVTIDTFANVSAFPGSYIFVNPKGLVPNMSFNSKVNPNEVSAMELSTYGIGGYYMIIRSSHAFGEGKADTTIDAVWVSSIEDKKEGNALSPAEKEVEDKEKVEKCKLLLKANEIAKEEAKEPQDTVGQKE